ITLLGFAFGLLRPGVMAGASLAVGMDEQGGVAGLMNATGGMAVTFAPFIGMSLYQFLPQAPYAFNILLAIGLLLAAFLQPQLRAAGMRAEA
ncbi:MAG TPA: MFS transporter, partial [Gammaproteobacteria bacterium]|nr:MFS transporter [Gammaproteobacteria bacterium]